MNFTVFTYNVKDIKWDFSQSKTYYEISFYGTLFSFIISLLDINLFFNTLFISLTLIFSFIIIITKIFRITAPEYQKKKKTNKKTLQITDSEFIFNYSEKISFSNIKLFEISFYDYYGKTIDINMESGATKSIGLDNYLKIGCNNKVIERRFQLTSKAFSVQLQNIISDLITSEKFSNINPKDLIKLIPKENRKKENVRDYIAKQIKTNKLNNTEGLLMMNYSSDKEAKELRKKYSL